MFRLSRGPDQDEFGDGRDLGVTIEYSKETKPLGTAGAVKLAQIYFEGPEFLVMNGDSFLELDLSELIRFHHAHGGLATMAVVQVENAGRYGTVHADSNHRITEFSEKTGDDSPGLINAGVYVFSRALLDHIPHGPASLEKDVFPKILGQGVYAAEQRGIFIDIGTPADYARAQHCWTVCTQRSLATRKDRKPDKAILIQPIFVAIGVFAIELLAIIEDQMNRDSAYKRMSHLDRAHHFRTGGADDIS